MSPVSRVVVSSAVTGARTPALLKETEPPDPLMFTTAKRLRTEPAELLTRTR